jgi:hypothetical protein
VDPVVGLERFLEERWRGQRSTIWGDQARQALLNHAIYRGIFDLKGEGVPDEAAAPTEGSGEPQGGAPVGREGSGSQAGAPVDREGGG